MYEQINVADRIAVVSVHSGWNSDSVKLIAATFPIVPAGTIVDKLSFKVPEGLHALMFFCRAEGPHMVGSGQTAYLDTNPRLSSSLLLSWEEGDGKVIIKVDKDMSASELAKFNSFIRSITNVFVVDSEQKIAYVSDLLPHKAVDPAWTYKTVSMNAILEYITKKLTMDQLDERATSEQQARDELAELLEEKANLMGLLDEQAVDVKQLRAENTRFNELCGVLMKSRGLYSFLKRLPVWLRSKMFDGFIEATDKVLGLIELSMVAVRESATPPA